MMVRAGRWVMSKLHRFFNDDDHRRREIDRLFESLDAASATPHLCSFPAMRGGRRCRHSSRASRCTRRPDGRRQLMMTGVDLLEKLVPLIPPTHANLTRFITAG
jgi:hypothetical protein